MKIQQKKVVFVVVFVVVLFVVVVVIVVLFVVVFFVVVFFVMDFFYMFFFVLVGVVSVVVKFVVFGSLWVTVFDQKFSFQGKSHSCLSSMVLCLIYLGISREWQDLLVSI